ncbi:unnamed protein product [Nezara viridula]|uniref:Uncharacterized protein n=1 Tax=Nezara viridula TaxID=85310 RepID=A0A9P0EFI8_NEZVI|nr:unnamed protein product [Nezara viridula]
MCKDLSYEEQGWVSTMQKKFNISKLKDVDVCGAYQENLKSTICEEYSSLRKNCGADMTLLMNSGQKYPKL